MSSSRIAFSPALTLAVAGASLLALVWYASFLLNPAHIGQPVAYALLVVAELIGFLNVAGIWIMMLRNPSHPPLPEVEKEREAFSLGRITPDISVFITVAGEPLETVKKTIDAALAMDGKHRTVVLDDGESDELKLAAKAMGAEYLTRPNKDRKKAGNVNYGLSQVPCEYFAILDCDHVPKKEFLTTLTPYLLADPKLALAQSPQFYGNTDTFVAVGSAENQEAFYRHIQTWKNKDGAAFCIGTNMVFRRAAVDELGGIYEGSNSEDIWTSLLLHERGWKSLYVPVVLAVGETPDTVDSFFRQQTRWATGSFEILLRRNPLLNSKLTLGQQLQYFHTVTYYLGGFSAVIFYLLPLLYTYLVWRPIEVQGDAPFVWIVFFLPYYVCTVLSTAYLLGRAPSWRGFVMSMTTFTSHVSAFVSAAIGKNVQWSVSGVIKRKRDYITAVAPHLLLMLLTAGAMPVLLIDRDEPLRFVFLVWMAWNVCALFEICKRSIPKYASAPEPRLLSYA